MKSEDLLVYINNLYHSCSFNPLHSHILKSCPNKEKYIAKFLEDYSSKKWVPSVEYSRREEEQDE